LNKSGRENMPVPTLFQKLFFWGETKGIQNYKKNIEELQGP